MRLYDISEALRAVLEGGFVFDEETGEVLFDSSNLDDLKASYDEKLEACAIIKKECDADAAAIREEEKRLAERRHRLESKSARMADYIARNMIGDGLQTPKVSLSWRKSKQVIIEDESAIPSDFIEMQPKISKKTIGDAIKAGETVPGASMIEKKNLVVK